MSYEQGRISFLGNNSHRQEQEVDQERKQDHDMKQYHEKKQEQQRLSFLGINSNECGLRINSLQAKDDGDWRSGAWFFALQQLNTM